MQELNALLPNLMRRLPEFWKACGDTLLMEVWAGSICYILGLIFGIILTVTKPGGIMENRPVYQVLDKIINLFRCIGTGIKYLHSAILNHKGA